MDEWVIMHERRAKYIAFALSLVGLYSLLIKAPMKLANIPYTFFWMFIGLVSISLAASYFDSLQRIKEMPRLEYLKKKGIR